MKVSFCVALASKYCCCLLTRKTFCRTVSLNCSFDCDWNLSMKFKLRNEILFYPYFYKVSIKCIVNENSIITWTYFLIAYWLFVYARAMFIDFQSISNGLPLPSTASTWLGAMRPISPFTFCSCERGKKWEFKFNDMHLFDVMYPINKIW